MKKRETPLNICIDFLGELSSDCVDGQRFDLKNGIYCVIANYDTVDENIVEAHIKYIDVHCMLLGEEYMYFDFLDETKKGDYVESDDFIPVHMVPGNRIRLTTDTAVVLFPNEAHMGKISVKKGNPTEVKKVIFKIPIDLYDMLFE